MKKKLAVCVLLLLSLLVAWWWKGTGEDPRLLLTIDVKTTGDFGAMLSVNPDGSEFASGVSAWGDKMIIWDSEGWIQDRFTKNERSLIGIQLQENHVKNIVFSPDWELFAWCRSRGRLSALGFSNTQGGGSMNDPLPAFGKIYSVAVGPHAQQIAFHGFNDETKKKELCVYWPERWEDNSSGGRSPIKSKLITLEGVPEDDTIRRMAFSPDGNRLLGIGQSYDIYMWDIANTRLTFTVKASPSTPNFYGNDTLVFSPDSKRFALVEDDPDDVVRIRSSIDGSVKREFAKGRMTICLGFSPNWKWYAIYRPAMGYGLTLHSIEDGRLVHTFKGPKRLHSQILDAAFSGDSRRMVTSSYDRTYRIWDLTDLASP